MEYNVRQDDIRKTEDKLFCNEKGLPISEYPFFSFLNKVKIINLPRSHSYNTCQVWVIKYMNSQWVVSKSHVDQSPVNPKMGFTTDDRNYCIVDRGVAALDK